MQEPDVGQDPAFGRDRPVVVVAPRSDLAVCVDDDLLVEGEQQPGDDQAGDDQGCEHLVRGNSRRLHRDDLAVLVERREGDQCPEEDREGQEARDQQRKPQRDVGPEVRFAIAGNREDLPELPEQVERHQDEHQRDEDRKAARDEQLHRVESEPARREELQVDHAVRAFGRSLRTDRAARVKAHSIAPIGCPPGRCASTWYIQKIEAASSDQRDPQRQDRLHASLAGGLLRILVHLVIGDDDHDPNEDAERGAASLRRNGERHGQQRQHQHHQHFCDAEVEVGLRPQSLLLRNVAQIAVAEQLRQRQLFQLLVAAAAEIIDAGQGDRQIVEIERQGPRRRELGRVLDQAALFQPEQDHVGIVGRQESAASRGRSDRRARPVVDLHEDAVELGSAILASVDAQGHALARAG